MQRGSDAVATLGEQIGACRCELNKCSAVVNFQPTSFNSVLQAGSVFRGRAFVAEKEGAVEVLDINPAILNWFESVRMLYEASRSFFRVSEGRSAVSFKAESTFSNAW